MCRDVGGFFVSFVVPSRNIGAGINIQARLGLL